MCCVMEAEFPHTRGLRPRAGALEDLRQGRHWKPSLCIPCHPTPFLKQWLSGQELQVDSRGPHPYRWSPLVHSLCMGHGFTHIRSNRPQTLLEYYYPSKSSWGIKKSRRKRWIHSLNRCRVTLENGSLVGRLMSTKGIQLIEPGTRYGCQRQKAAAPRSSRRTVRNTSA